MKRHLDIIRRAQRSKPRCHRNSFSDSNPLPNAAKTAGNDDARDFSAFQAEIDKASEHLKSELSKLKAGGLDLEAIEALRVNLGAGKGDAGTGPAGGKGRGKGDGKGKGEVVKVGDVAQVVPRGRMVVIMVGEKDVSIPSLRPCLDFVMCRLC